LAPLPHHTDCFRVSIYAPYVVVNRTHLDLFTKPTSRFSLKRASDDDRMVPCTVVPPACPIEGAAEAAAAAARQRWSTASDGSTGPSEHSSSEAMPMSLVDSPAYGLAYLWVDKPDYTSARARIRTADSVWSEVCGDDG